MSNKYFHLQLNATYQDDKNTLDGLVVEVMNKNKWENLELSVRSPGFLLYINGLFSCQHLYVRTNSAERNLVLTSATAEMKVETDEFWHIQNIEVKFDVNLKSGTPTADDIEYIHERMHHCPVSSNLPEHIKINNRVNFLS